MKKMWKKTIGMICAGGLSVICLAGCGKDAAGSPEIPTQEIQQNNVEDGAQADNHTTDGKAQADNHASDDKAQADNHVSDDKAQADNHTTDDKAQADNHASDDKAQADNHASDDGASGSMGDGAFLYGANLQGNVIEFSETGFSLSPASTEEGGKALVQTAPGSERDEDNIQITYTDNTVFQIVNFSIDSQSGLSREDTDKESVKKQSSVCVFGSCQDTYHWTADKILILRYQ